MFLGAPLLPGPALSVLTGVALTVLLMARIAGGEAMQENELEGYREYTQKVRFRLVPFLW